MTESSPALAPKTNAGLESFVYMERLQEPFVQFLAHEITRAETLYEEEYGLAPVQPHELPAEGTPERDALEDEAVGIIDSMFLAELGFGEGGQVIRQAAAEHPGRSVRAVLDLDGTVTPLVTPEIVGAVSPEHVTVRTGLPVLLKVTYEDLGLRPVAQSNDDRTLAVLICSTRREDNIKRVAADINNACTFTNESVVDMERSLSAYAQPQDFERNLTYERACEILNVLNPELPGLDPQTQKELYEQMQVAMLYNNGQFEVGGAGKSFTAKIVAKFLESLDAWSRMKIPALADVVHRNPDMVFAYLDDAETPGMLQHDRLYCKRLGDRVDDIDERFRYDSRFRALDDPLYINGGSRSRKVLAVMKLRYEHFLKQQETMSKPPTA